MADPSELIPQPREADFTDQPPATDAFPCPSTLPEAEIPYGDYLRFAQRCAYGVGGDHHGAEDAAQHAVFGLWRASRNGHIRSVRGYLANAACNAARDQYRTHGSRYERYADPTETGRIMNVPEARSPEQIFEARENIRLLNAALAQLSFDEHTALRLSVLEGKSGEEIGAVLNRSRDAALHLVSRSRKKLREFLAAAENDGPDN